MAKNSKSRYENFNQEPERKIRTTEHRPPQVHLPNVVTMDELAMMSDDELLSKCSSLNSEKAEVSKTRINPIPWEVELAYIQRELQIRQERRIRHRSYMQVQRDITAEFFAQEDVLPDFVPNVTSDIIFN